MILAVIFDMDGLMVDSEPLQRIAMNRVLARYGVDLSEADWREQVGKKTHEIVDDLKLRRGFEADTDAIVAEKGAAFRQMIDRLQPMPGLDHALDVCQAAGVKLAVASGSPLDDIRRVLAALDLTDTFPVVVSGQEVHAGKPDPAIFIEAARRLGVAAVDCLVLEDAVYGVQAAKSAGMTVYAVPNGYTSHQDFSAADRVLAGLDGLVLPPHHGATHYPQVGGKGRREE